jgi:hypothetical protein
MGLAGAAVGDLGTPWADGRGLSPDAKSAADMAQSVRIARAQERPMALKNRQGALFIAKPSCGRTVFKNGWNPLRLPERLTDPFSG